MVESKDYNCNWCEYLDWCRRNHYVIESAVTGDGVYSYIGGKTTCRKRMEQESASGEKDA